MKENTHVRQIAGEPRRRWFSSENLDVIVWLNDDNTFAGFELCYDKMRNERSIRWHPGEHFLTRLSMTGSKGQGNTRHLPSW